MTSPWTPQDTTNHQDHVIAHVLGATFLGHFVFDEALYVLLDIGFIWTIFLDGEMGLLPHPVAVSELAIDAEAKQELKGDIDLLLSDVAAEKLLRFRASPVRCQINDVSFWANGERRRLLLSGEDDNLTIETSLEAATIEIVMSDDES